MQRRAWRKLGIWPPTLQRASPPPTYLRSPGAVAPPGEQPPGRGSAEQTGHSWVRTEAGGQVAAPAHWLCRGWGCLRWRGLKVALPDPAESGTAAGLCQYSQRRGEAYLTQRGTGEQLLLGLTLCGGFPWSFKQRQAPCHGLKRPAGPCSPLHQPHFLTISSLASEFQFPFGFLYPLSSSSSQGLGAHPLSLLPCNSQLVSQLEGTESRTVRREVHGANFGDGME